MFCSTRMSVDMFITVRLINALLRTPPCFWIIQVKLGITRMWNMMSSPATNTVSLEQKSKNFQSRNVTLTMPSPSKKIIAFEIVRNVAYYIAAKFTFPIEQPSDRTTKCGIRRSCKLKVKPNNGCSSSIALSISYILVFVSFSLAELLPFKRQGHPVSLWCWLGPAISKSVFHWDRLLACIIQKDNYDICIYWRDIALATCCHSQPLPNMNMEGNFEATLWRHRWRQHHKKNLFGHNFERFFLIWGQIEVVFNISKFLK